MAADIRPPELAELLDVAERPRAGGWSLRSALVRYAQSNPVRVSQVMEHVRRIEAALHPHAKLLVADGPALCAAASSGAPDDDSPDARVVGLLRASLVLDEVADALAVWADDRSTDRPDAAVDAAVAEVARRLDELGIPHEERPPPRGARSRG